MNLNNLQFFLLYLQSKIHKGVKVYKNHHRIPILVKRKLEL